LFGIGGFELVIILIFAFLIFGPDKLPKVIKDVTHVWEQLKGLRQQADQVIKAEVVEPLKDIEASVNPFVEEGKSATDMLASRLGIKTDPPKKDAPKKDAPKKEASAKEAIAPDAVTEAAIAAAAAAHQTKAKDNASEATATKATETTKDAATGKGSSVEHTEPKPKPKPKPKTESFAEKKAALDQAHRDRQKSNEEGSEPTETKTKVPAVDEADGA